MSTGATGPSPSDLTGTLKEVIYQHVGANTPKGRIVSIVPNDEYPVNAIVLINTEFDMGWSRNRDGDTSPPYDPKTSTSKGRNTASEGKLDSKNIYLCGIGVDYNNRQAVEDEFIKMVQKINPKHGPHASGTDKIIVYDRYIPNEILSSHILAGNVGAGKFESRLIYTQITNNSSSLSNYIDAITSQLYKNEDEGVVILSSVLNPAIAGHARVDAAQKMTTQYAYKYLIPPNEKTQVGKGTSAEGQSLSDPLATPSPTIKKNKNYIWIGIAVITLIIVLLIVFL